jgi:hypothetical protein
MKINIISDLHIDKSPYEEKFISSDLLIIAGDTCPIHDELMLKNFLDTIPKNQQTLYLLGNHEFLFTPANSVIPRLRKIMENYPHIQVVDNQTIIFGNIRFICSTLWSDFLGSGLENYQLNKDFMTKTFISVNSFFHDKYGEKKLVTVDDVENKAIQAKKYLELELSKSFQGKTIVVTHFAPFKQSEEIQFAGAKISAFWVNSLEYLQSYQANLWIHGHIHEHKDYTTPYGTRVIANPRGNKNKTFNHFFDPYFTIDI